MKKCSEIIRGLREDKDLSQTQLAKIIGTTQQQYSKYETENAEIPVKVLSDLADFYGTSTDFLLGRVVYKGNVAELEQFLKSNTDIGKMLSDMKSLSPKSINSVIEYVELQKLKENKDAKNN